MGSSTFFPESYREGQGGFLNNENKRFRYVENYLRTGRRKPGQKSRGINPSALILTEIIEKYPVLGIVERRI
ncbi:hypothetical protein D0X99_07160 [Algoriphagus lacus]|uniref:Uncharacterized protein n=1 Tax=Algoriphagus lacus TaxID=2056311 RepID=A0A418PV78_9BACT|nr:hypothetical protein D0X99_07160 [Algoriphagus lacus]